MKVPVMAYKPVTPATCWPNATHELLLKAVLLTDESAQTAWQQWQTQVDFFQDSLSGGSYRLLPLVYRNFLAIGIDDPLMSRLKGIVRNTWTRNQILVKNVVPTLQALNNNHIQTLLLGDAALTLASYADYGAVPMNAFDIAVQPENASGAINQILQTGEWTAHKLPLSHNQKQTKSPHKITFRNNRGHQLNLTWRPPIQSFPHQEIHDTWAHKVPFQFNNVNTFILCPADHFLTLCRDGLLFNRPLAVDWIAHSVHVLKQVSDVGWQRLIATAQNQHQVLAVRQTLHSMTQSFDVCIPSAQ
ncbi:MAG: hypothetical protein E4H27_09725, partial [Anaerolineales bacterium]